jgi:precorrin-2 dehydrogenase/sirohydrochlorin ferrochelatase
MGVTLVKTDLSEKSDPELLQFLTRAWLAVAATPDNALNDRIGALCRSQGILFNNACGEPGDVVIPSVIRGDNFTLSISTGGESPAISRYLREHLQSSLPCLDRMIGLQGRLRRLLWRTEPEIAKRKEILVSVLHDQDAWEALREGDDAAWNLIKRRYLT